ncbi:hypothetical protein WJX81_007572 [Elliptochloris bilobata]|uniref:UspA domain-containing protein n=1 Tax=Elliptochloris bilobata TaxID=381761 RepID=A0AAW1SDW1_9CHLO
MDAKEGRHLVVAVDDCEESEQAVDFAQRFLFRPGDTLHLVHVLEDHEDSTTAYDDINSNDDEFSARLQFPAFVPEVSKASEYAVEFITDRLLPRLSFAAGATEVHTVKRPSQYAHRGKALVQEAAALNAALIVLSPHERDFTANSYHRSLANFVAQHASCPVTVVHTGPAEARRNSISASFRRSLERLSLLPGGKGAGLFGRNHAGGGAQQPEPIGGEPASVPHSMGRPAPEETEGALRPMAGSSMPRSLARLSSYFRHNNRGSSDEGSRPVATH